MSGMLRVLLFSQEIADHGASIPFVGFDGRPIPNMRPVRVIDPGFECAFIDGKLRPFTHEATMVSSPDLGDESKIPYIILDEISRHFPDTVQMAVVPAKYVVIDGKTGLQPLPIVIDRQGSPVNQEIWKKIGYDPHETRQALPEDHGKPLVRENLTNLDDLSP